MVKYNSPQYISYHVKEKSKYISVYFQIFTRVHIQLEIPIQNRLLDKYITHLYIWAAIILTYISRYVQHLFQQSEV